LDARTLLLPVEDVWFCVALDVLPEERYVEKIIDGKPERRVIANARYDIVQRRSVSRVIIDESRHSEHLYGSDAVYGVSKRQISTREFKAHELRA
jgi:hypothetical protein